MDQDQPETKEKETGGRMHRTFLQVVEKMREKEAGRLVGKVALTQTITGSSFNKMENNLQISTQL